MNSAFAATMEFFASLGEPELGMKWSWRGRDLDLRYVLYQTLQAEQAALSGAAEVPPPGEAGRILRLAQRALGDLCGLLVGLGPELLDAVPIPGQWSVREALRHVLLVERRYAMQTLYAVDRPHTAPLRIPEERLPTKADVSGEIADILHRLVAARLETDAALGGLPDSALTGPADWANYEVDVRFRLHRLAEHIVEHTIQCEKALDAAGWRPAEGRRVVRRIWAVRAEVERVSGRDAVTALDRAHRERAESARRVLGRD